jgi:hypothetical protein
MISCRFPAVLYLAYDLRVQSQACEYNAKNSVLFFESHTPLWGAGECVTYVHI